jgi:hypothetical protein
MKRVIIEVIPHQAQRYNTVGDWFYPVLAPDNLTICVSNTGHWHSNMLIAVHELVEAILCKDAGITQEQVDKFDFTFTKYLGEESGDAIDAPYRDQHCIAMAVERMLCGAMQIAWAKHEERIEALDK